MEQPPNENMSVEFYPSLEDNVHIAVRISASVPTKPFTWYAYHLFLALNVIVFPAFLFFNEYLVLGLIVFGLNLAALFFIIPRVNPDTFRTYYSHLYGDRENKLARAELRPGGIHYRSDEGESFCPWRRITEIEETEESIYFYFDGNGFGVRKAGFAYIDEKEAFVECARKLQASAMKELVG